MKRTLSFFILRAILFAALFGTVSCRGKEENASVKDRMSVAVFIPGALSGSPTYEMLASGVREAARGMKDASVTVIEAGYNQAEWETKLTAVAATGKYRLIVSSNPSMPDIAKNVALKFPDARFMIFDADYDGNSSIWTLNYDNSAQAYVLGYLAALIAKESGPVAVGLVAAQNYPVMDNIILPSYRSGAVAADASAVADFRIVGGWSDADKAMELADSMIEGGVKVILTIAGAGNEGVVRAAEKRGAKVLRFDTNAYSDAPGVIAGCCAVLQDKAATEKIRDFAEGKINFGSSETAGFKEGYLDFIDRDPNYVSAVSAPVRLKMSALLEKLRSGQ